MTVPSSRWFPLSFAERAGWFQTFSINFATLGPGLGFTPLEIADVNTDNASVQLLYQWSLLVDNFSKGMTSYRREVLEGKDGDPEADQPQAPDFGDNTIVLPGIYERLDKLVKRIKVAPSYSDEEGQQLGIVAPKVDPIAPGTNPPVLKLYASPGNVVNVEFIRGNTDGIRIQTSLDKSNVWNNEGTFKKSPAAITIPAGPGDLPRSVQVRARFVEGNDPVGDYSDIVTIATMP